MNSKTQRTLEEVLRKLRTVALSLAVPAAEELVDSCTDAIEALQEDETVRETRT